MPGPPPLTLAIEASNPGPRSPAGDGEASRVSVCLGRIHSVDRVEVMGTETIPAGGRDDEGLIPAVDRLVRGSGCAPRDLGRIAVSSGPGGFTALRLAVAFAKMVCEVTRAECIAVPTARALIRRVDAAMRAERPVVILLAWKRLDVWAERYEAGTGFAPIVEGTLLPLRELPLRGDEVLVCDAELEATLRTSGGLPPGIAFARPHFSAAAVLEASASIAAVDPMLLSPLYPREPEAATKWRELKKRSR